jgi:cytochrome P450
MRDFREKLTDKYDTERKNYRVVKARARVGLPLQADQIVFCCEQVKSMQRTAAPSKACNGYLQALPKGPAPRPQATAGDDDALSALIFEALRFRPINPMVVRVAKEDYRLAADEPHQTLIRKGTTVFALTWSAMFDPRALEAPEEFRFDRPDYQYLHFATGLHACYGRYIIRIQIPHILKPLLKLKGLRPTGAPEYDGTFPETFRVEADI